jgi:large subunit ribosomal protein L24
MKVHKGDTVLVISGKDKGAKGKVLQAFPTREKVLVHDSDGNPTRIGYRFDEETGKKVRVSKKNGKDI